MPLAKAGGHPPDNAAAALDNSVKPPSGEAPDEPAVDEATPDAETSTQSEPTLKNLDRPRKVLVLGDSLAATAFGALLERSLDEHPMVECVRRAKSATGLARPDFFDWVAEGKQQAATSSPDLIIVILGGNDGQDLIEKDDKRGRVQWQSEAWDDAYALRVQKFVDVMAAEGRRVMWLGLPRTDTKNFEGKLVKIRAVQQDALAKRPEAVYVDTTPLVTDNDGNLLRKVDFGGRSGPLRESDGIHFTMHGSRYFAERVFPLVLNELGLEPVQPEENP